MNGGSQQINGREGETATFLSRCPLNSELRVGGFAPRHLNRWAFLVLTKKRKIICLKTKTLRAKNKLARSETAC